MAGLAARLIVGSLLILAACAAPLDAYPDQRTEGPPHEHDPLQWTDLAPPIRERLANAGLSAATFEAYAARERTQTAARLRDGSFDQAIYYALQSTRLTLAPAIEPALSARTFVETLARTRTPDDAAARLDALAAALLRSPRRLDDARLALFRQTLLRQTLFRQTPAEARPVSLRAIRTRLRTEYARAMAFLYEKEFVAPRAPDSRTATAALYHVRAHSTDTQIEAGFAVAEALATLKALMVNVAIGAGAKGVGTAIRSGDAVGAHDAIGATGANAKTGATGVSNATNNAGGAASRSVDAQVPISRVLIVGPGLDVAPRTGLLEDAPPQSYQPFAVADALLALQLADRRTLRIDIVDINPMVVRHFRRLAASRLPVPLFIEPGLRDDARTQLTADFREYVRHWGDAIRVTPASATPSTHTASATMPGTTSATASELPDRNRGIRAIAVDAGIARAITARQANIVVDRLAGAVWRSAARRSADRPARATLSAAPDMRYDLIIITNVLPYLDDVALQIALSNIAAALAPGGALIHNEPRPLLLATTAAIGLPALQARTVRLASPVGGDPLFDTVILHRKN